MGIEYQGEQHYKEIGFTTNRVLQARQKLDQEKTEYCNKNGISLIHIPYWWDGSIVSKEISLKFHVKKKIRKFAIFFFEFGRNF